MKPLSRLESLIAEIVERPAWGLSQRRVHPLELTTALIKAMERRAVRLADRILAPDQFELHLNPADLAGFADAQPLLERELGDYLLRTFEERDLSCNLPPAVSLAGDDHVKAGKIQVTARFSPTPEPADRTAIRRPHSVVNGAAPAVWPATVVSIAVEPRARTAALDLLGLDGGVVRSFRLDRPRLIIGRRSSTDIPLQDIGVSREHARLERDGVGYAIVDLNSTNGTFVNDQPISGRRVLRDGDVVSVGRFRLRFVPGSRV
ncbi:MAG: FhaA domain-containing protein [Dehalococcoidia bacterium]